MERKIGKAEWQFLILCLLLGVLAEEAFFHGVIGISYFIFITVFYSVLLWHFRKFSFTHQRFGYLLLICIWLLSASYFFGDNIFFYLLNIIIIPGLIIFHLFVVTRPNAVNWDQPIFITYLFSSLFEAIKYNSLFVIDAGKSLKGSGNEGKFLVWKKMMIGVVVSIPVLIVVLSLLMAADAEFKRIIGGFPDWFHLVSPEAVMRFVVIVFYTFGFFGFLHVIFRKQIKAFQINATMPTIQIDQVIGITVLVIINAVYLLFTAVQFKYFFSGSLQGNLTYAEYARKGFYELLFVTLINLSITVTVLRFSKKAIGVMWKANQVLLSILVFTSAVILSSAFLRLSMYEEAYGFTFMRVLVHSFMIFLGIIFTYTFIKIWLEKLSLFHFYFVSSLIYYTVMSVVNINQIVVKEDLARYQASGKIDINYLNSLSYTGVLGLIDLYEKGANIDQLKSVLQERQNEARTEKSSWRAYNLKQVEAETLLKKLNLK